MYTTALLPHIFYTMQTIIYSTVSFLYFDIECLDHQEHAPTTSEQMEKYIFQLIPMHWYTEPYSRYIITMSHIHTRVHIPIFREKKHFSALVYLSSKFAIVPFKHLQRKMFKTADCIINIRFKNSDESVFFYS